MGMFDVDQQGLAKLLERRGKKFAPLELVQNSMDEDGVTRVSVTIAPSQRRGYYELRVEDDAPDGFHDLAHAYTLFAESKKKGVATKRGRWNLGEKLVIAICCWAEIRTTTGTITFADGEREHSRARTEAGSIFTGVCRMTHVEAQEAIEAVRSVLVPKGIALTVNGEAIDCRVPQASVDMVLSTELADAEGFMRPTKRMTTLGVFDVAVGEVAHVYEMGIPVVEIDCDWHIDIGQKVPLSFDRDNIKPAYRRDILTAVVNLMHGRLDREMATKPWVGEALASKDIVDEAVRAIVTAKHGDQRVAFDPSDPEGSKIAVTRGYEVVHGGNYSSEQWDSIRRAEAIQPAGQVTPSPKPFHKDGSPLKVLPQMEWTDAHARFAAYARAVARELVGHPIEIVLANDAGWGFSAAYKPGRLTVNVHVNRRWFDGGIVDQHSHLGDVDRLLIHEFAHHRVSDHLSEDFHEECCKLGSKLVQALRAGRLS